MTHRTRLTTTILAMLIPLSIIVVLVASPARTSQQDTHAGHNDDESLGHDPDDGDGHDQDTGHSDDHDDSPGHDQENGQGHPADDDHEHVQDNSQGHAQDDGHGHGHGDTVAIPVTVWTDRYEVFAEYPPLVKKTPATFVTHITVLDGFAPRRQGPVTFVLQQGNQRLEFIEKEPRREGIYLPDLTFPQTGTWNLSLQIPETDGTHTVSLGSVLVHADDDTAAHTPLPSEVAGFGFLKEQQWCCPFQVELIRTGNPHITVPAGAISLSGNEHIVYVQLGGETFDSRHITLGPRVGNTVEITSGLQAGERIVTLGASSVALVAAGATEAAHGPAQLHPENRQLERLNLAVQPARAGGLDAWLRVPGEIKINHDTLAHMVPRAAGIVKNVHADLGDYVRTGQVLAIIESRDLAMAKADYLALKQRLVLAQTQSDREEHLHQQKISSEVEYLEAKQQLAEIRIQLGATRQKLLIMGMRSAGLESLSSQPEESFADYALTAPFDGTIIAKHIVLGEAVDNHSEVFKIADLSHVWADLLVTQQDVAAVQVGQRAIIVLANNVEAVGTIQYVDPVIHPETRAAVARVVLDNSRGEYRPGLFISGKIRTRQIDDRVIVPTNSIQSVNDERGVFVQNADGFEFRPVITGLSDQTHIEILAGLTAGEQVVTRNAFHLKAEMSKGAVDAHAGHSH
ncbi:efflux RND transporter periplasmic adaptor subunit [Planctomycetota bacterium]